MNPRIWLRKGEKAHLEKPPIALINVLNFVRQRRYDLKHKGNLVSLQFQTEHFKIKANLKQSGMSFRKKTAQKLNRIKNNPLSIIVTILTIYWELIPLMIDVGPITPWEFFKTLCMVT